jgi:DNA polymerase V
MNSINEKDRYLSPCGFPSPAENYAERPLDLHRLLVRHPASTFFFRASEKRGPGYGIFPGDILIVDRAAAIERDSIVLGVADGEFILRSSQEVAGESISDQDDAINSGSFEAWGVVLYAIHNVRIS